MFVSSVVRQAVGIRTNLSPFQFGLARLASVAVTSRTRSCDFWIYNYYATVVVGYCVLTVGENNINS
jgi:hypothetical protein